MENSLYEELKILEKANPRAIPLIGDKKKYGEFVSEMSKKSLLGKNVVVGDCYDSNSLKKVPDRYVENQIKLFDAYSSNPYLQKILNEGSSFLEEGNGLLRKFKGPFAKKSNRKSYNKEVEKFSELVSLRNCKGNSFLEDFFWANFAGGVALTGGLIDAFSLSKNDLEYAFYVMGAFFGLFEVMDLPTKSLFSPNSPLVGEREKFKYLDGVKSTLFDKK